MTTQRRAFAFVKLGSFSGANEHILRHLSLEFPDLEPAVIDLSELRVFRKRDAVRLTWSVAREYGASACMTKGRMLARMLRTEYAFDALRARVLQQLGSRPFVFTFQTQSLFDASVSGIPHFIYTDHTHLANLSYPGKSATPMASAPWRAKERLIYDHARLNFTMSSHITRSLIEQYGCSREKVRCVYAGGNIQPVDPQNLGVERFAAKRILFVGLEWERKGGPVLLEAFRQVRRAHPTAELVIVGCSPQVSVPGCRILGRVPLAEVAKLYRSASVFCLPTNVEPFGFVFLEAFAHGLPIVATDIGAIPDFIEEGKSGFMVECWGVDLLARRLSELLTDPARCAAFGARGRALVSDRYTWSSTAHRIAAHIKQSIGIAGPGFNSATTADRELALPAAGSC